MKKFFKILLLLVVVAFGASRFNPALNSQFSSIVKGIGSVFRQVPCEEPLKYDLGSFSKEFDISQKYFLDALAEAEAVWEKSFGKELFAYAPLNNSSDILRINLIYDYRQQATETLKDIGIVVENNRSSYESLKVKLASLKSEYETKKSSFTARVASFNQKQDAFRNVVEYWNNKGGAPREEYDKLKREQASLEAEAASLQSSQNQINAMVGEINALVVVLNRLIASLNLSVDKYNTISTERGESFEEGVYYREDDNASIDIYEFSSRSKLVRVLAHELGHALGLEHIEDPKAVMYRLNVGDTEAINDSDLEALKIKCGVEE